MGALKRVPPILDGDSEDQRWPLPTVPQLSGRWVLTMARLWELGPLDGPILLKSGSVKYQC